MKTWIAPALFVCAVVIGYRVSTESWNGVTYVHLSEQRSPAAVKSKRGFAPVDREALAGTVNKQLLAKAKLKELNGYMGVTLGHPIFKRARGTGEFACPVQGHPGVYDKVELTFWGTGVSEGGEPARMVVEGACAIGNTLSEMRTIWIPMKAILASKAKDQELQLFGDQPVTVRLQKIPGHWPEGWVLRSVRLYREMSPQESLLVDAKLVREANPKMLAFAWRKPASK